MLKIIITIMYLFSFLIGKGSFHKLQENENNQEIQDINEETEIIQNISQNSDKNNTIPSSTAIQNNTENKTQKNETNMIGNEIKQEQQNVETNTITSLIDQEQNENQNTNVEKHPELAFSGYTQRNSSKENAVIAWIKDELSKQPDAVEFGFTVQSSVIAKENSTGFTMLENRVRNRVKNSIGGNYYIYVEDHYLYNSDGTEASITDTWVYVYTQY